MFSADVLRIDAKAVTEHICTTLVDQVLGKLRRKGAVVGISGGVDSAVVAALCVRALGKERVFGLFMPERHSASESLELGQLVASGLGIETKVEELHAALEGLGWYRALDDAIRLVVPEYGAGWKSKVILPSILAGERISVSQLAVQDPSGKQWNVRLTAPAYRQIVAATNFKQRTRKMVEYYHADRLAYAVAGTPNLLEYDQGFFVKQGDGAADFKPIAHLYKTQVYALAEYLGVPAEIRSRPPTTDTFSLSQTQEEFYFALPYDRMDLCLYAYVNHVAADEVGRALDLTVDQVGRVFRDIEQKRKAAAYLHQTPLLIEDVAS